MAATLQHPAETAVLRTVLRYASNRNDHRRTPSGPRISSTSTATTRVDRAQRRLGFRVRSEGERPETGTGALDASHSGPVFARGAAQPRPGNRLLPRLLVFETARASGYSTGPQLAAALWRRRARRDGVGEWPARWIARRRLHAVHDRSHAVCRRQRPV